MDANNSAEKANTTVCPPKLILKTNDDLEDVVGPLDPGYDWNAVPDVTRKPK
jgi:hypothetical protein